MRRAEVWWAELPPPVKSRPVVILTRNAVVDSIESLVVGLVTRTIRGLETEVSLGRPTLSLAAIFFDFSTSQIPIPSGFRLFKS